MSELSRRVVVGSACQHRAPRTIASTLISKILLQKSKERYLSDNATVHQYVGEMGVSKNAATLLYIVCGEG